MAKELRRWIGDTGISHVSPEIEKEMKSKGYTWRNSPYVARDWDPDAGSHSTSIDDTCGYRTFDLPDCEVVMMPNSDNRKAMFHVPSYISSNGIATIRDDYMRTSLNQADDGHWQYDVEFYLNAPYDSNRGGDEWAKMQMAVADNMKIKLDVMQDGQHKTRDVTIEQLELLVNAEKERSAKVKEAYDVHRTVSKGIDDEILHLMNDVSYDFDPYSYRDNLNETITNDDDVKTVGFEQLKAEAEHNPKGTLEAFITEYGSEEAKEIFIDTDDEAGLDKVQQVKDYYDNNFKEKSSVKLSGAVAKFMNESDTPDDQAEDMMSK